MGSYGSPSGIPLFKLIALERTVFQEKCFATYGQRQE
jgi:hypothetical protein